MRSPSLFPLVLLAALLLAACSPTTSAPAHTLPANAPEPAHATGKNVQLIIDPEPTGAQVNVDGRVVGTAPLTVTLAPGQHRIEVSARGYETYSETISLEAGREATYAPELIDSEPPVVKLTSDSFLTPWDGTAQVRAVATDNARVLDIELSLNDQVLTAAEGNELVFALTPSAIPNMAAGRTYTLTATATDAAGNMGQAWLPLAVGADASSTAMPTRSQPTPTPAATRGASATPTLAAPLPPASPTSVRPPAVSLRETQTVIPTYPYTSYLREASDPLVGNYPLLTLDRPAYEASRPQPVPAPYALLVLENLYLRLTILPELGGRIYEVIFKPTGNNALYRNPVIKPTTWGPGNPPHPAGANWWLAAGGIEWGFPVEEHGYEWGKDWGYDTTRLADGGMTVTLFTGATEYPFATVRITLRPDAASFTVQPTLTNPTSTPMKVKWWSNAMLAPGPANSPGPDLHFVFPAEQVTIHSRGDDALPAAGQSMPWPLYQGRDLRRLANWGQYLGFFARPAAADDFVGVYDATVNEGMIRIFPKEIRAWRQGLCDGLAAADRRWRRGPMTDRATWRLHGGLAPTFGDSIELPAGGELSWSETWYPLAGIGGVTHATARWRVERRPGNGRATDQFRAHDAIPRGDQHRRARGGADQTAGGDQPGAAFQRADPAGRRGGAGGDPCELERRAGQDVLRASRAGRVTLALVVAP